ncbi:hypothetical protein LRC39_22025 [Rhodopseudomonas sp. P1]|uniref:hypothetical protein n=1 Tax=Rhodopseudomonas sp. P1 TaxID=3434357 RepID=UPI0024C6BD7C|nr:hypothetical protein KQX64_22255 [Rhodopseudomonas palustris]
MVEISVARLARLQAKRALAVTMAMDRAYFKAAWRDLRRPDPICHSLRRSHPRRKVDLSIGLDDTRRQLTLYRCGLWR